MSYDSVILSGDFLSLIIKEVHTAKEFADASVKEVLMFSIFFEHKFLSIAILVLLFLSIISQIIVGVLFQNMIKESDNMPTTENKLLKQCKLKFINCFKLNGKMLNTSVFVDKFISRIQLMGISLTRLTHLSGQLMMLSVVVTGIAICLSLAAGDTLFQIIPYYLSSILGLYLYFSVSGIVDLSGKKTQLKTNLVDYLENHLMPRLEIEKESVRANEEGLRKINEDLIMDKPHVVYTNQVQDTKEAYEEEREKNMIPASTNYQEELEDLLKEFFA